MRDPMSWALPLFRAFGIPVKVHIFFFIITLGLFIRQVAPSDNVFSWQTVLVFPSPSTRRLLRRLRSDLSAKLSFRVLPLRRRSG